MRASLALLFVSINAGLSGAFASFRGSTFLVSGASHAALGGAALMIVLGTHGLFTGIHPILGGAVFAVILALIAGEASNHSSGRHTDTAIGVGFALAMAAAVLFMSLIPESASRVWGLVMGDLLLVTYGDLWLLGVMTVIVMTCFGVFRREFLFITFDMEGARAFGVNARAYNYLLFGLIGLSSAILVKGIGAILVFAMLSAPPATALLVCNSVGRSMWMSFLIALVSGLIGIVLSFYTDFSVSALAALFATGSYFTVRAVQWVSGRVIPPTEEVS